MRKVRRGPAKSPVQAMSRCSIRRLGDGQNHDACDCLSLIRSEGLIYPLIDLQCPSVHLTAHHPIVRQVRCLAHGVLLPASIDSRRDGLPVKQLRLRIVNSQDAYRARCARLSEATQNVGRTAHRIGPDHTVFARACRTRFCTIAVEACSCQFIPSIIPAGRTGETP